jgi:aldose 1-epimerase
MYRIVHEDFDGLDSVKLMNPFSGEYLSVIPFYGGNIQALALKKNKVLHDLIIGDQNALHLSGMPENAYRGAKLSPFPNRIKEGTYVFDGVAHHLPCNDEPNALHGLLWNASFEIKEERIDQDAAVLVLEKKYDKEVQGFPFCYAIEIEYRLGDEGFSCKTTIVNTSTGAIPMGDGWHPYLTIGGSSIDGLRLQIPSNKLLELDQFLIPTGNYTKDTTFSSPSLLKDVQLDHCYELEPLERRVETLLVDTAHQLTLVLWQESGPYGYNFIQVYTPSDRRSVAIEPMSCAPDAFNNHNGLFLLEPEESVSLVFGIRLE